MRLKRLAAEDGLIEDEMVLNLDLTCPGMTPLRSSSGLSGSSDGIGLDSPAVESVARISVNLPRSLYRQFRLHALEQDTTLSALLVRLIRQEIKSNS